MTDLERKTGPDSSQREAIIAEFLARDIISRWTDSWVTAVSPLLPLPGLLLETLAAQTGRLVLRWAELKTLPGPEVIVVLEEAEGLELLSTYDRLLQLLELPEAERPFFLLWGARLRPLFGNPGVLGLAGYVRLQRPEVTDRAGSPAVDIIRDWQAATDDPLIIAVPEAMGDWPEWFPGTHEPVSWIGPRTALPAWWRPDALLVLDQRPGLASTYGGGYEYGLVPRNRDRWLYRARRQLIWAEAIGTSAEDAPLGWLAEVAQLQHAQWLEPLFGSLPVDVTPTPLGPGPYRWLEAWLAAGGDQVVGEFLALMYDTGRSALIVPPLEAGERWEAYDIRRRALLRDWAGEGRLLKNIDAWNRREQAIPTGRAALNHDVLHTWEQRYRAWTKKEPPMTIDLDAVAATLEKVRLRDEDLNASEYLR